MCAICGATVALANAGLLDQRPHTSNGAGFLDAFCPSYKGQPFFVDAPSVSDGSLITAGATGALMWTKQILERLDVFSPDTLRAWYDYFSTGEAQSFFALMQSLPSAAIDSGQAHFRVARQAKTDFSLLFMNIFCIKTNYRPF